MKQQKIVVLFFNDEKRLKTEADQTKVIFFTAKFFLRLALTINMSPLKN